MKLRNKKTGAVYRIEDIYLGNNADGIWLGMTKYTSLAEVNEEWEDYEEPKDTNYWYIDDFGGVQFSSEVLDELGGSPNSWIARKLFGNYFETKEEAEKAVEKLKALERLRKNGFRFDGFRQDYTRWSSGQDAFRDGKRYIQFNKADDDDWLKENWEDLKLVFKEEE